MAIIDVTIDGPSSSIVEVSSGKSLATRIRWWEDIPLRQRPVPGVWSFDWDEEATYEDRMVAGLFAVRRKLLHGLISFEDAGDHLIIQLVESAPWNVGAGKQFSGVPGNLLAFACLRSMRSGYDGELAFVAKSELVDHYERTLGAVRLGSSCKMVISASAAKSLVDRHMKGMDQWPV